MRRALFALCLSLSELGTGSLVAQSYHNSFSPVNYDRSRGPSVLKGGVDVDAATGAVSVEIPLGPGIGARGAQFCPTIRGRHAVYQEQARIGPSAGNIHYLPSGCFGIAPGSLRLSGGYYFGSYDGPQGESEHFGVINDKITDTQLILQNFGYSNGTVVSKPTQTGDSKGRPGYRPSDGLAVTDSGALVIPLSHPTEFPPLQLTAPVVEGYSQAMYSIPQRILVVKGDIGYEYVFSNQAWYIPVEMDDSAIVANVRATETNVFLRWASDKTPIEFPQLVSFDNSFLAWRVNIYRPDLLNVAIDQIQYSLSRILNRFGEYIQFDYGTRSTGLDYMAEWFRDGKSTNIKIKQEYISQTSGSNWWDTQYQVRLSYEGVEHTSYLINLGLQNSSAEIRTEKWWDNIWHGFIPLGRSTAESVSTIAPMINNKIISVVPESAPSEAIEFTWEYLPISDELRTVPVRLTKVTSPGREVSLSWEAYEYMPTMMGDFGWWIFTNSYIKDPLGAPKIYYAFGVKQLDDKDTGNGQVRTTSFIRKVPTPDWTCKSLWKTTDFYAVVIYPDHSKTMYRYLDAKELTVPAGAPPAEGCIRATAFWKNFPMEERHYGSLTSWESDISKTPNNCSAQTVILRDRLTLISPGNPSGIYSGSSQVIPTRVRELDLLNQRLTSSELVNWSSTSLGWRQQRKLTYMGNGIPDLTIDISSLEDKKAQPADRNPLVQCVIDMEYSTNLSLWWLARNIWKQSTMVMDATGSTTSPSGFLIANSTKTLDDLNRVTQAQTGASFLMSTVFSYDDRKALPQSAILRSSQSFPLLFSGNIGSKFDYDQSYGFLSTIHPSLSTANLTVSQVSDAANRPTSQVGMDSLSTGIKWDPLGRLNLITPPGGDESTSYTPDPDGLGVVIERGVEKTQLRYNAYGELVLERKFDAAHGVIHRALGYDLAGRKIWETTWRKGSGDEFGWNKPLAPDDEETLPWTEATNECASFDVRIVNGQETYVCTSYLTVDHPYSVSYVNSTHTFYDEFGRVILTVDPNGSATKIDYSFLVKTVTTGLHWDGANANPTPATARTIFLQDANGRLVKVVNALDQVTEYFYDGAGRITEVRQYPTSSWNGSMCVGTGTPQRRFWVYNGIGWLVVLDQPESGVTYYTSFTVQGKPTETIYGLPCGWRPSDLNVRDSSAFSRVGAKAINVQYDDMGRTKSTQSSDGTVDQANEYGAPGVVAAQNVGKLVRITTRQGFEKTLDYDPGTGRLSALRQKMDGLPPFEQSIGYDTYGRVALRIYPDQKQQRIQYDNAKGIPSNAYFNSNQLATFCCDDVWLLHALSFANGATSTFLYDRDQVRLASLKQEVPGSLLKTWKYNYNDAGQLGTDGENWYTHDQLGRLTLAYVRDLSGITCQGVRQEFAYDSFGNRLSAATCLVSNWEAGAPPPSALVKGVLPNALTALNFSFNRSDAALARNRLPTAGVNGAGTGALYDTLGNLQCVNTIPGAVESQVAFTYDALSRVVTQSYGSNSSRKTEAYLYDDEGLRIKVLESTGKIRYNIYNEARQLIAQYEKTPSGPLTWKKDIVYVGTKEIAEVSSDGKTSVTLCDHLGSPRYSWDGTTLTEQKFLPFGEPLASPTASAKFAKGFTNHEQTDASGLIYMQARFYLPAYGRFASPDPARDQHFENTQSWNIYSYVCNNPVMMTDPTGMFSFKDAWDYTKDVGRSLVGEAKGVAAVGVGIAKAVAHPVDTAKALGNAAAHPIATAKAVGNAVSSAVANANTPEQAGKLVGNALANAFLVAAPFASAAGGAGEVANAAAITERAGATSGLEAAVGETRVTRWMGEAESVAMKDSGNLQFGAGGRSYVTDLGAPQPGGTGPVQVNFNVPTQSLQPAGNQGWYQILDAKRPPVTGIEVVK